jgi:hypothetical protein
MPERRVEDSYDRRITYLEQDRVRELEIFTYQLTETTKAIHELKVSVDDGFTKINGRVRAIENSQLVSSTTTAERDRVAVAAVSAGVTARQFWIGVAGIAMAIVGALKL